MQEPDRDSKTDGFVKKIETTRCFAGFLRPLEIVFKASHKGSFIRLLIARFRLLGQLTS